MAIQLTKGQRVDVGLQQINVGLGWDPNSGASPHDFDLDASAFMLGSDGQVVSEKYLVYYGNQESADGSVKSSGDDRTGGNSDGDDEILSVDLRKVDPKVEQIIFAVSIYEAAQRRQNFGQVRNSFIRLCDATNGQEVCKYELDEDFSVETAVEFARLYKRNGQWRFEALGIANDGGLEAFVSKYAKCFT